MNRLTRYHGRPADEGGRLKKEIRVYDFLDRLGIGYDRLDHEPAFSSDEALCAEIEDALGAMICKNLLLCNRQETQFYLLMIPAHKAFRSGVVSKQAGSSRLSFAGEQYMERFLDTTPGSASVMGLMNDTEGRVQLLVDEEVLQDEFLGCHPCINTSSLRIRTADVFGPFLKAVKHDYIVIRT